MGDDAEPVVRVLAALGADIGRAGAGSGGAVSLAVAAAGLAVALNDVGEAWPGAREAVEWALTIHGLALDRALDGALGFARAREALEADGDADGGVLSGALVAPLALAGAAADLAELGEAAAPHVRPEHRPEVLAATRIGAAVAGTAVDIVLVNSTITVDDPRLAVAEGHRDRAEAALRRVTGRA